MLLFPSEFDYFTQDPKTNIFVVYSTLNHKCDHINAAVGTFTKKIKRHLKTQLLVFTCKTGFITEGKIMRI